MAIPGNFLGATTEQVDPNTSGWTPKQNCTISLGSGGRNGDGVLRLTSSASGEMQARTVTAYAVTVGETYYAFADASGATVPERIGIRWMRWPNIEVGLTWSVTTSAASASWHRISVAGVAPADATAAQIVVSSTPAASGVVSYFENAYLGLPIRTTGNLFAFNTESGGELDVTGWFAEVNSAISRQAPMATWPVDWYLSGGHVIAMTATAAGNASVRSTDRPAAEEGREYWAYCYLNPPTAGAAVWVELRFYDNGVQIGTERAPLAQPGTGWYRQQVSGVAPPGTNECSIAAGIDGASAGQVLRLEGVVVKLAPQPRAGTVVPYEDASFEQGVGGWSVVSGPATIARSTPWGAQWVGGAYSLQISSATAATSVIRSGRYPVGEAAGQTWRTEVYTKVTAGAWTLTRAVRWYDASNALVSTTSSSAGTAPTPDWWILGNSYDAPATATQAEVEWTLQATAASSVIYVDRVALWQGLPLGAVEVDEPRGRVTVTLRELTEGNLITVWRIGEDGARTLVRGLNGLIEREPITSDIMVIEDYEAPLGVPVSYYAERYSASTGALTGSVSTAPVTLEVADRNLCWIKDPSQPQRNIRLRAAQVPDWSRPVRQTEHVVRARRNAVTLSDVRGGLTGELAVWTDDDDQRKALHFALDPDHVMLVQFAPGLGIEDVYVRVGDAQEPRVDPYAGNPRRRWVLPLTQQDMPVAGISGTAGWTVQDVVVEYATGLDVLGSYATVLDLVLDKRKGA